MIEKKVYFDTFITRNQPWHGAGAGVFRSALFHVLCLGVALSNAAAQKAPAQRLPRQQTDVLFLSASDPDLPDVASLIEQAETRILEGSDRPVHFSFEYLESSSSFANPSLKQATASYLLQKYRGQTFDLVIAIDEETVAFGEQIRAKLFPDAAVLFFVTDPQNPSRWLHQEPGRTGVMRKLNYLSTLQLALRQNPGTSHVVVISGASDDEKRGAQTAHDQFRGYESQLDFQYLADLQFSNLEPRLADLPPGTVVIFLDFITDARGEQFIPARILPAIAKTANRPIYGTFSSVVGAGVVGGSVADLGEVGQILGNDGVRILKGEKPENIPVATGDFQHYVIDWRELHRWGIPENQIPKEGEVRYWQYSPWELYRWRILGLSALLLIETLLIILLLRNIVQRKRAQETLRRKEEDLAEAQQLAGVGNWVWDPSNKALTWSEELYRIHGFDPNLPLPDYEEFSEFFAPESWVRLNAAMEEALRSGSIQELDLQLLRADGSNRWISVRGVAVRDTGGHVTHFRGTAQDITERKQAEEARSRLAAIVQSSDDAIISQNLDGIIMSWNRGAEHIFGFSEAEAVGQPITILIPRGLGGEQETILRRTRAGEKVEHYETLRMTKEGRKIDVSLTISPIRDATGKIIGASKIARDITAHKHAQEELKKSEERFSKAFRHSPMALSLVSANTNRYLDISETFERIWGYTRADVIGKSALDLGLWVDPAERARLTQKLELEGSLREVECAWRTKDGHTVISSASVELIEIEGEPCFLGVFTNITDRKEIEEELRASQARMAGIVASAMDAIIAADHEQKIVLFNAAAEKMFGCPAGDAIGNPIEHFIPQRFRAAHSDHIRRYDVTGVTNRALGIAGRLWALRADGQEFPIEASISQVEVSGKKLFTVVVRDVTERRLAEEAVLESERRFRLVANTAPVMIWTSGLDKLCDYFNQPWLQFTGRSLAAELGNGWSEGVHPDDLTACLYAYTKAFDARQPFETQYRLRRHDGEYRWVLDKGVPRFSGDNSFAGYIGSCIDITDRKLAEEALSMVGRRLIEAQEQERSRIARELHDDINQRLALLANRIQESDQATSAHTDSSQKKELREIWRLTNEIATDIQYMSHQLHPSKLHYLGLAATARDLCHEFSRQHRIEVECVVQDLPPELDENISLALYRVVQESLRNVVKHSHAHHVKVDLSRQSNMFRLRVSDDGIGFNPEHVRGTHGLGLISMRERLRAVGGEFSIWSKPSLGTQVEGRVPAITKLAPRTEETGVAQEAAAPPSSHRQF
ncbi:MAG TPA: PAS domain S-box protein [Terriglobales bacterium]